jgi:hypothetical protein
MTLADEARGVKKAELDDEHRVLLREKVALFLSREADDVQTKRRKTRLRSTTRSSRVVATIWQLLHGTSDLDGSSRLQ